MALPKFTNHGQNRKNEPLDSTTYGRAGPVITDFLDRYRGDRATGEVRILDVGCGRGARVSWLCEQGWDAWGVEIIPEYLDSGRPFFDSQGWGSDRLQLIEPGDGDGLPFRDAQFDVVLSDQVIEHVEDLDQFVAGIARVTKSGGVGMHIFPATLRPVEPHLRQPLVHWIPKGRPRRAAISLAVRGGIGVTYFADHGVTAQTDIYAMFSDTETYYRLRRTVARTFQAHGFRTDLRTASLRKTQAKLGSRLPAPLLPVASLAYSLFLQTHLTTIKS
jgi:ubiquinone/menaquinone biosynthesis C-methylase UbiE